MDVPLASGPVDNLVWPPSSERGLVLCGGRTGKADDAVKKLSVGAGQPYWLEGLKIEDPRTSQSLSKFCCRTANIPMRITHPSLVWRLTKYELHPSTPTRSGAPEKRCLDDDRRLHPIHTVVCFFSRPASRPFVSLRRCRASCFSNGYGQPEAGEAGDFGSLLSDSFGTEDVDAAQHAWQSGVAHHGGIDKLSCSENLLLCGRPISTLGRVKQDLYAYRI